MLASVWASVAAAGDTALYGRVVFEEVQVRSGPGAEYRQTRTVKQGERFAIQERSTRGFWYRIELPDATTGWVVGEALHVQELSVDEAHEGRFMPWLFAPPPLLDASGELCVSLGVLGGSGWMAVRPSWLLDPTFAIEGTLGGAVGGDGRLFTGTVGGLVNIFPSSVIVPFVAVGGGAVRSDANADAFLMETGFRYAMYGGGGLRFGFRSRLIVRVDVRVHSFFDANQYTAEEEISGGISAFF
jgi:uncharacterized protein YgiM (DUF1202 family)